MYNVSDIILHFSILFLVNNFSSDDSGYVTSFDRVPLEFTGIGNNRLQNFLKLLKCYIRWFAIVLPVFCA